MLRKITRILFMCLVLFFSFLIFPHMHSGKHKKDSKKVKGYSTVKINPDRVHLIGVTREKVTYKKLKKIIRTVGIVEIDETKIVHIHTKFNGWIQELYADFIGMPVVMDQPLFSVYSPELVSTQQEYLSALEAAEQPAKGKFSGEFRESNIELLKSARDRLVLWDISDDQISRLEKERLSFKNLIFRSPVNGIIIDKKAFAGMRISEGMQLYNISDLSNVWVMADIYETDVDLIKVGQKGKIKIDSFPEKVFKSYITFLDYVVENKTRTVKARFEIPNKDMKLKPGMFSTVNLKIDLGTFLALPQEALIDTGKRKIVFVERQKGVYEPKEIETGFKAENYYQVISGLSEGQEVVTSAQFLLDSESRLKALEGKSMRGHGY